MLIKIFFHEFLAIVKNILPDDHNIVNKKMVLGAAGDA
jgi:hypothetical protein